MFQKYSLRSGNLTKLNYNPESKGKRKFVLKCLTNSVIPVWSLPWIQQKVTNSKWKWFTFETSIFPISISVLVMHQVVRILSGVFELRYDF